MANGTGFIGHESSGEAHSFLPKYSRVSTPEIFMPKQESIVNSIDKWMEELRSSPKHMKILAEMSSGVIGKGDDDLRMREMTPEEGEPLMMYAKNTAIIMMLKRIMTVSCETFTSCLAFSYFSKPFFFFGFFTLFYY